MIEQFNHPNCPKCPREYSDVEEKLIDELLIHPTIDSLRRATAMDYWAYSTGADDKKKLTLVYAKRHKDIFMKPNEGEVKQTGIVTRPDGTHEHLTDEMIVDEEAENKDWTIHALQCDVSKYLMYNK